MAKKNKKTVLLKLPYYNFSAPVLLIFIFAVYLLTLAPSIGFRDSGDMVTSAYLLGISHPSGFPLYMLLGKIFTYIPFNCIAYRVNLMSAFFAALAVLFVFLSVRKITGSGKIAWLAAFFLAFSSTFWTYAEFGEKYTLYAFFAALLIWLSTRMKEKAQILLFAAFFLGLGLTHHISLIVFVLPVLFLFWSEKYEVKNCWKPFLLFLLPLFLYAYIPIRASADPVLNWGHPVSLEKVLAHISAKDYRYAMFSAAPVALPARLYVHLVRNFVNEFTLAGFLLGLFGFYAIFKISRKLFIFLILVIASNILIFVNYNILDPQNISTYYFASFVVFTVAIGAGAFQLVKWSGRYRRYIFALLSILIFYLVVSNRPVADLSHYDTDYNFGRNILRSVDKGSLVLVNGDMPLFSLWYLQYAEGYDKRLDIIPGYRIDLEATIKNNFDKQKIYLSYFPYESLLWKEFELVPAGMVYIPQKKNTEVFYDKENTDKLWKNYEGLRRLAGRAGSPVYEREKLAVDHYLFALTSQGEFYMDSFLPDSLNVFQKALEMSPGYAEALIGAGRAAEKAGRPGMASGFYNRVLQQNNRKTESGLLTSKRGVIELLKSRAAVSENSGMKAAEAYFKLKVKLLEGVK